MTGITKKENLSGKKWWSINRNKAEYANSTSIDKLDATFRENIKEFKKAITDAGANVSISTTQRSEKRAYILHWAYKIAKAISKNAALEMITEAQVAYQPSLTSNHIKGKAIDWTITWTGTLNIKNKQGKDVEITSEPKHGGKGRTHNGNTDFHAIGKTYGVIKANFKKIDGPHWSIDGK